jgi:hypothetical protein
VHIRKRRILRVFGGRFDTTMAKPMKQRFFTSQTLIFANLSIIIEEVIMKLIIFTAILFSLIAAGCGNQVVRKTAGQIISNSWEGENELDEKDV